jgi:phage gpG-like protein
MSGVIGLSEFIRRLQAVSAAYTRIPNEIAALAVKFSKERFRDQSWIDGRREPWAPRASRRAGGQRRSQTLLVDSGRLKRSIRKISATPNRVIIGTDVPYAQIHNEGFKGPVRQRVRSHTRALTKFGITSRRQLKRSTAIVFGRVKTGETTVRAYNRTIQQDIPARPFIGSSAILDQQLITHIQNRFQEALNI